MPRKGEETNIREDDDPQQPPIQPSPPHIHHESIPDPDQSSTPNLQPSSPVPPPNTTTAPKNNNPKINNSSNEESAPNADENDDAAPPPPSPGADLDDPKVTLASYDWDELEARFCAEMDACSKAEEEIGEEFKRWLEVCFFFSPFLPFF